MLGRKGCGRVAVPVGVLVVLGLLHTPSAEGGGKPPPKPPSDPAIAFGLFRGDRNWQYAELKVMDADGSNPTVLVSLRTRIGEPAHRIEDPDWSPDGRSLVFKILGGEEHGIYTVNRDGSGLRLIVGPPVWGDPAWSPLPVPGTVGGGKVRIAYAGDSLTDLFLVDPDGSDPVQVTGTTEIGEEQPTWSPSGTRVALELYKSDPALSGRTLGIYDFETDAYTEIAPGGPLAGAVILEPSWSKTSENRIAVRARMGPGGVTDLPDLWILDLNDLDHPFNVTNTADAAESFPSWSPDDSRIVFNAGGFGTGPVTIEVVNADGTGRQQISPEGAYPSWRRNP